MLEKGFDNRVCKFCYVIVEILCENWFLGILFYNGVIDCILGEVCGGIYEVN